MPSPLSSLLKQAFGLEPKQFEWRVMLPNSLHIRFNRMVFPLMMLLFIIKILQLFKHRSRLISAIVESRNLEKFFVLFMRLYKLCYVSIYAFELTHLKIWSRMPSMALHHLLSSLAFVQLAWKCNVLLPKMTALIILPYVVHTIYWGYWLEDAVVTIYNITLFFAVLLTPYNPKDFLVVKVLFILVVTANYWAYCDDMIGTYCIGTLIGHDVKLKMHSFYYVPNTAGIASMASFLLFVALPYIYFVLRRAKTKRIARKRKRQ